MPANLWTITQARRAHPLNCCMCKVAQQTWHSYPFIAIPSTVSKDLYLLCCRAHKSCLALRHTDLGLEVLRTSHSIIIIIIVIIIIISIFIITACACLFWVTCACLFWVTLHMQASRLACVTVRRASKAIDPQRLSALSMTITRLTNGTHEAQDCWSQPVVGV